MYSGFTRAFLKDLGAFLQLPGVLCLPTFAVIAFFGEWYALLPFAVLAAVSFGLGQLLYRMPSGDKKTLPGSSYEVVSLAWFLLPLLGTIPFYGVAVLMPQANAQVAIFADFHSAFFESMSGLTGTGLTMLDDSSQIPHCLQWWRSLCEWIGGLGIIFLAVAILDTVHSSESLYQSEAMGWMMENKKTESTIRYIWWIYLSYSVLSVLVFYGAGMPFWEALNHGLTGISTGGFSVTKDSFASYSPTIKWIAVVVMLMGAFSFKIHYILLVERNFKRLFQQTQLSYFAALFLLLLLMLWFVARHTTDVVDVFFQTASALATCGFSSVKLTDWSALLVFPLLIAMFLGGNSSSTTGGLKTQRFAWLVKTLRVNIRQSVTPDERKGNIKIRYNGDWVALDDTYIKIRLAAILLFVWLVALTVGTFLLACLLHEQFDFYAILFEVNSALNNVGLSSGVTGHQLPAAAKWIFSIIMWIGRLEVLGVIIMFSFFLGRNK